MTLVRNTMPSPVGPLRLYADEGGLVAILFAQESPDYLHLPACGDRPDDSFLCMVEGQLQAYFEGQRKDFTVPLNLKGTDFQKQVWGALQTIPYGETRSYAAIARQIGRPKAMRAVGAANGRNPIPVIIPCHRVIGADGTLTGFSGGLDAKTRLLAIEGVALSHLNESLTPACI